MLTKEQFNNIFEDVFDGFKKNIYLSGLENNPFSESIKKTQESGLILLNYINSKETPDFDSKEFFDVFSSFAKDYSNLLHQADDYYKKPENPKPEGVKRYNDRFLHKGNVFVKGFFDDVNGIDEFKDSYIGNFKRAYKNYTGQNLENAPKEEEKVAPKKEEKIEVKPEVKAPAVPVETPEQEMAHFKKIAEALDHAKTFSNSKEYKNLMTACKTLGDPKAKLTPESRKAMMAATGKTINDYLMHKAKDGVKPNVFKKFAAVEALSKYLDTKLEPYKNETINIGKDQNVVVADLKLGMKEYKEKYTNHTVNDVDNALIGADKLQGIKNMPKSPLKSNMVLAMNFLRKVGFTAVGDTHSAEVSNDVCDVAKKFADPEFAKGELGIKSNVAEANQAMQR